MRRLLCSLGLALSLFAVAGCTTTPPVTDGPVVASTPAPPSAAPTTGTPGPAALEPDSYARVLPAELQIRSHPGDPEDPESLEVPLEEGVLVVVVDGPVPVDDIDWYQVQPTHLVDHATNYPFGWIPAAAADGTPWLEPASVECPPMPASHAEMMSLFDTEDRMYYEITCLGGTETTFEARLVTPTEADCEFGAPWTWDPGWLAPCRGAPQVLAPLDPEFSDFWMGAAWQPGVDMRMAPPSAVAPEDAPIVEVTGAFDHPAARTCTPRLLEGAAGELPDPAQVVLWCRTNFVVTAMRAIGRSVNRSGATPP